MSVELYNLGSVPVKEGIFVGATESRWAQSQLDFLANVYYELFHQG